MRAVLIYVDGACSNNGAVDAIGGYGCILIGTGNISNLSKEISGVINDGKIVTNQRAELMATIVALEALKCPCEVTISSDSQYVISTMKEGWKRKCNHDLWDRLDNACKRHSIRWVWVRGHSGNSYNERCDLLATQAISRRNCELTRNSA